MSQRPPNSPPDDSPPEHGPAEGTPAAGMASKDGTPELPFPTSLCHTCAAPPRYIRTQRSTFILCPLLPTKYPPQPVARCPLYQPRERLRADGARAAGEDSASTANREDEKIE